jgi:hypothetical protein
MHEMHFDRMSSEHIFQSKLKYKQFFFLQNFDKKRRNIVSDQTQSFPGLEAIKLSKPNDLTNGSSLTSVHTYTSIHPYVHTHMFIWAASFCLFLYSYYPAYALAGFDLMILSCSLFPRPRCHGVPRVG